MAGGNWISLGRASSFTNIWISTIYTFVRNYLLGNKQIDYYACLVRLDASMPASSRKLSNVEPG